MPGKPLILRRIEGNTLRVLPCRPSRPRTGPPDPGRLHGGAGWAEAAAICNLAHEARLFALLPKEKDPHPASPFRASVFSLRGTGIGCKENRQSGGYGGNGAEHAAAKLNSARKSLREPAALVVAIPEIVTISVIVSVLRYDS